MITINRILCPTDLSSESDEALRYAVALASAYDAELLLLWCHGGRSNTESSGPTGVAPAPLFTSSLAPHLYLKNYSNLKWKGLVVNDVMDIGKAIVIEAAKHEVDLIVMRSRRRPHAAALLGSTAETVSRSAKCPVLITHPLEREWVGMSSGEIDIQRILVAYDFSGDSQLALSYGLSLAQEYQTELQLLNVLTKEEQEGPEIALSPGRGEVDSTAARSNPKRSISVVR